MRRAVIAALAALLARPGAGKTRCDVVIEHAIVVTVDADNRILAPGSIAISGGRIVAVGRDGDVLARYRPIRRVDGRGKIAMPGLVNTHTHAAMSLLRGMGADRRLEDWLNGVIFPAEAKNVTRAFVRDGTELACLEMIEGGTTTFADMYYFESDVAAAVHRAGLRAVLGETFIDFPAPDHKDLAETISYTREFLERWKNDPLIRPAVAPHAPYTCSKETLLAARKLAAEFHVPIEIHVSETRHEVDEAKGTWKMSPPAYLQEIGFFGISPTILAHVVWPEDGDFVILAKPGVGISHNPESNMKLASGIAPVARYEKAGIVWSLGTDGPASNDDLSMFEAMDYAAKLAKVSTDDPTALPAREVLRAATIGGARVLGLDARVGSLEPGKEADVILIDTTAPHAVPGTDPEVMIVYSLKASDVTDVWVAGRRLLDRRKPLTLEAAGIGARARGWRRKIEQSLAPGSASPR